MDATKFLEDNFKDVGLITGVPCSFFKGFINAAINCGKYIPAVDEGAAVAIATGYQISSGKKAVVLMQNSGIGNAVSPLTSLNYVFKEPITMMVSHRGENDEPQHELMGTIDVQMLTLCNVYAKTLNESTNFELASEKSIAYIVPKGTFEECPLNGDENVEVKPRSYLSNSFSNNGGDTFKKSKYSDYPAICTKYDILKSIVRNVKNSFKRYAIIATTGYTGRELFEIDDSEHNLYMVGSMGCAMALGLGMALGDKDLKIIVLDGDGALLMRTGTMGTIGHMNPSNLIHFCFNNGFYDTTGNQSRGCNETLIHDLAVAFNYGNVFITNNENGIDDIFNDVLNKQEYSKSSFIEVCVKTGHEKVGRPTLKPFEVKNRLIEYIKTSKK